MAEAARKMRKLWDTDKDRFFLKFSKPYNWAMMGLMPNGLSQSMFLACIRELGSYEQKEKWLTLIY